MKFTIAMLFLVLSANVFAFSSTDFSEGTSFSGVDFNQVETNKIQSALVLNDSQVMFHTGVVSVFLSQKIQQIQDKNKDLSEAEALDILIEASQAILAK